MSSPIQKDDEEFVDTSKHEQNVDDVSKEQEDLVANPPSQLADASTEEQSVDQKDDEPRGDEQKGDEDDDEEEDEDEDDVKVTIEDTVPDYNIRAKQRQPQQAKPAAIDLDAGQAILDVDLNSLEDKPWRKPGADISDYFNYGFDEDTWKLYCEKQKKMKSVVNELSSNETFKIPVVPANEHSKYSGVMKIPTIVSHQAEPRFNWMPMPEPDDDRDRGDRERDRVRDREKNRDRDKDRDREKDREREKERDRDREKDRDRDKERDREKDRDREKNRERDKARDRDKNREREKEKSRDRDRHRDGGKKREREKSDRERDREKKRKRSR